MNSEQAGGFGVVALRLLYGFEDELLFNFRDSLVVFRA
jgi:hypothetical protein